MTVMPQVVEAKVGESCVSASSEQAVLIVVYLVPLFGLVNRNSPPFRSAESTNERVREQYRSKALPIFIGLRVFDLEQVSCEHR
jgi:hypothetical protein